jgi:hypothetical protein
VAGIERFIVERLEERWRGEEGWEFVFVVESVRWRVGMGVCEGE